VLQASNCLITARVITNKVVVTVDVLYALSELVADAAEAILVDLVIGVRAGHLRLAVVALEVVVCVYVARAGYGCATTCGIAHLVVVSVYVVGTSSSTAATATTGSENANSHNKNEQETKDSCFHGFLLFFCL
jgi:hypothetical protein